MCWPSQRLLWPPSNPPTFPWTISSPRRSGGIRRWTASSCCWCYMVKRWQLCSCCMIVKYLTEVTDIYFILVVYIYLLLCYSVRIYPHITFFLRRENNFMNTLSLSLSLSLSLVWMLQENHCTAAGASFFSKRIQRNSSLFSVNYVTTVYNA